MKKIIRFIIMALTILLASCAVCSMHGCVPYYGHHHNFHNDYYRHGGNYHYDAPYRRY